MTTQVKQVDLMGVLREILHWCDIDAANEDGHPSQEMLDNRTEVLHDLMTSLNGPLIAAAPDMLDFCKWLKAEVLGNRVPRQTHAKVCALISLAQGGDP